MSNEDLVKRIEENREKSRKIAQARNDKKKMKKQLELIPYRNPNLNDPDILEKQRARGQVTLGVGDLVKLNVQFDKTDYNRLYVVKSIDWESKRFKAQKLNLPNGKIYDLRFEAIDDVIADQVRALSEQARKRRRLLVAAWGADVYNAKAELDFSITSEVQENIKPALQDSGNPISPDGEDLLSPENPIPEEIHPVEVPVVLHPKYVAATPDTIYDTTFNETAQSETAQNETPQAETDESFYSMGN